MLPRARSRGDLSWVCAPAPTPRPPRRMRRTVAAADHGAENRAEQRTTATFGRFPYSRRYRCCERRRRRSCGCASHRRRNGAVDGD